MPEKDSKAPPALVAVARITINAPPAKVFEKLSDVAKWNEWRTVGRVKATSTVRQLKGGDNFTYEAGYVPGSIVGTVSDASPSDKVLLWSDSAMFGLIKGEHNWRLRQVSGRGPGNLFLKKARTQVIVDQEVTGLGRVLVKEDSLEKHASQWLLDLKDSVEQS